MALKLTYVLLHQADLFLTIFAINMGYHELNPVIRTLLDSPLQLALAKVVIPVLLAWVVPAKLLLPAIAAIALVVGWNIKELVVFLF